MLNVRRIAKRIKVSLPNLPIALIQWPHQFTAPASLLINQSENKSNFASGCKTNRR